MTDLLPAIPAGANLYQRAVTNQIGAVAEGSNSLGYLATNKTQLEVVGQLTGQDPTDFYNFTFQNTGAVSLSVTNIDGTAPVHVQIYDGTGTGLIADNQGTAAQQQAYAQLTSKTGYNLRAGNYAVKVSYGTGGTKSKAQDYALQLGSGSTFQSDYRTLANATTIQNTLLGGGSLGYSPLSATASAITSLSNGSSLDVFGALSLFTTNIIA